MADAKKADAKKPEAKKASKNSVKKKKPNVFQRLWKYLLACKGELKKITWPSARQTTKNFGIVIAVIIVMGLFIFGLDSGLYALLGLVMGTGSAA
ncbi:MAG: preprotein translocase subunit SecE [Ruminococcus sp.]|nr:preprotein translocase subunit SecE [Ruminococcus sp.]